MAMLTYRALNDAIKDGWAVYDRTATGYLVRMRTAAGWAMAMVELQDSAPLPRLESDIDPEC